MKSIYVVWEHGDTYEPSYIVEAFSTRELAEAWANLHDNGHGSHSADEMTIDDPAALALIDRGTRPWGCTYFYEPFEEWNPEERMSVVAMPPSEPAQAPESYKYLDSWNVEHETWELTVIAPTAADARRIAVEQIESAAGETT